MVQGHKVGWWQTRALGMLCLSLSLLVGSGNAWARTQKPAPHVEDDPGCKTCVSTAASLFASGQTSQAAQNLREWSSRCPNNAQLHLLLSTIAMRTGNKQEAESEAAIAAGLADSTGAHLQYAMALMSNQKNMQAVSEFRRVTELDPGSYEAWSALSSLYFQLHEDEKANQYAAKAAALEPSTRAQTIATVVNLKRAGKYSQAATEINRLLSSSELGPETAQDLAREALLVGAFEQATAAAAKVSAQYPKSVAPYTMAALANYCRGQYDACVESCDAALKRDSKNNDAKALRALSLARLNKLPEAEEASKDLEATSSLGLLNKGTLEMLQGKNDDAEETLHSCLDQDAGNAALEGLPQALAHIALAELYQKTSKKLLLSEQAHAIASDKRFPTIAAKYSP